MRNRISIASLLSFIVTVAAAVCYAMTPEKSHSWLLVTLLAVSAVMGCIHMIFARIPWLEYVPFIFSLISLGYFVKLGIDEAYGIMSKANVAGLSTLWIASAILILLSVIISAIATVTVVGEHSKED